MTGIDVLAAEHYGETRFFGTEVVRSPCNAGIHTAVLYRFDNCRRILEFYNSNILTPVNTFFFEASANNGIRCSQTDCSDFLSLEIAQFFDGACIFLAGNHSLVATHEAANNANISTLRNMDKRSKRAKCTSIELSGTNGSNAIARIREFHQFYVKAVLLENARILCDEKFSLARRREVADGKFVCGDCGSHAGENEQECRCNSSV